MSISSLERSYSILQIISQFYVIFIFYFNLSPSWCWRFFKKNNYRVACCLKVLLNWIQVNSNAVLLILDLVSLVNLYGKYREICSY